MSKRKHKPPRRAQHPADTAQEQVRVRLKPILGVKPGTYLTVIYAIIALFILYMLLFHKGVREQGTYLQVQTFPPGAAIQVDGRYVASSPSQTLVRKGQHRISISKPYFKTVEIQHLFGGRIFGTLFVRPRFSIDQNLELADPTGLADHALQDFAMSPQIPEILSQTAEAGYRGDAAAFAGLDYFLDKSKYFVTNPYAFYEYLAALSSVESGAGVLTPGDLLSIVDKLVQIKEKYDNSPFWLAAALSQQSAQRVVESSWFSAFLERFRGRYGDLLTSLSQRGLSAATGVGPVQAQGLLFRPVPAGELLQGAGPETSLSVQIPHPVLIRTFYMADTEVPNRVYKAFLDSNPEWRKSNLDSLLAQGRVTADYLASWQEDTYPSGASELPVTGVSFFAAQAFCSWLGERLPGGLGGYVARLPYESEWEWAARGGPVGKPYPLGDKSTGDVFFSSGASGPERAGSSPANGYGLRDMAGNVWEWCLDWFSDVGYLFTSWTADRNPVNTMTQIPIGAEKVVRGGSWATEKDLVRVYTRASQPPSWCTPYLGFRVVLARPSP
jgi:iron(II)-dependent oxidoreductase